MKSSVLVFLTTILISNFNLKSQDTIVSLKTFNVIPVDKVVEKDIVRQIFNEKKTDYWEYRIGSYVTRSYDISYNGGCNYSIDDSLKMSKMHVSDGFNRNIQDNFPSGVPSEIYDYIIYKYNDKYFIINDLVALRQFLKPFDSLPKALYFLSLNGFSINYRNKNIYYKLNPNSLELIMIYDSNYKYVQLTKGGVFYYAIYYIRLDENGNIYKKKIGTLKYRQKKFIS